MAKLSDKVVAKALIKMCSSISATARALNVTRHAIRYRIDKNPELPIILEDARETLVDDAESIIAKAVLAEDLPSVRFVLSTLGKPLV